MGSTPLTDEAAADVARWSALLIPPTAVEALDPSTVVMAEVHGWREELGVNASAPRIPGSAVTHVRADFAGEETETSGHLPMPRSDHLSASVRDLLLAARTRTIVLYPSMDAGLASATRAWLVLRLLGAPDVRVLDAPDARVLGAPDIAGARPAGSSGVLEAASIDPLSSAAVIGAEEAELVAQRGTLLDARPRNAFEREGDGPSHIAGARSAPASTLLTPDGHLPAAGAIRRWLLRHRALGGHATAAYCGGGVQSSVVVFAALLVGQPMQIYLDSWSGYVKLPGRDGTPAPVGADPASCLA